MFWDEPFIVLNEHYLSIVGKLPKTKQTQKFQQLAMKKPNDNSDKFSIYYSFDCGGYFEANIRTQIYLIAVTLN